MGMSWGCPIVRVCWEDLRAAWLCPGARTPKADTDGAQGGCGALGDQLWVGIGHGSRRGALRGAGTPGNYLGEALVKVREGLVFVEKQGFPC